MDEENTQHGAEEQYRGKQETRNETGDIKMNTSSANRYDAHAIAALILGILSIISPFQLLGTGGLVGVILGAIGLYQVSVSVKSGENSLAHSGKVLSIIGLVISSLALIAGIVMLARMNGLIHDAVRFRTFDYGPSMMYFNHFMF